MRRVQPTQFVRPGKLAQLAAFGSVVAGILVLDWTLLSVRWGGQGRSGAQAIAWGLASLLSGGGVGLGLVALGWRGLQDAPVSSPSLRALRRLCPGCGRLASRARPDTGPCPRCGLVDGPQAWVVASDEGIPWVFLLSGALLLAGVCNFVLLWGLEGLPGQGTGLRHGVRSLLPLGAVVGGVLGQLKVFAHALSSRRGPRRRRASDFRALLLQPSLHVEADAQLDPRRRLAHASGTLRREISTPPTPVSPFLLSDDRMRVLRLLARLEWRQRIVIQRAQVVYWKRQRVVMPAVESTGGYRESEPERRWICDERTSVTVRIDQAHDPGSRLAQRLGWPSKHESSLGHLVERLERDRALFDAVARLGRRTPTHPEPDPDALRKRMGELAALVLS